MFISYVFITVRGVKTCQKIWLAIRENIRVRVGNVQFCSFRVEIYQAR